MFLYEQQIGVRNIQLNLETGESCITSTFCPNLSNITTDTNFPVSQLPQPPVSGTCIDTPALDPPPPMPDTPPPPGDGRSFGRFSEPCGDRPVVEMATLGTTFFDAVKYLHNRGILDSDVGMCIFGTDEIDSIVESSGGDIIFGKGGMKYSWRRETSSHDSFTVPISEASTHTCVS